MTKSSNPFLEQQLIQHRFPQATVTQTQNNGVQLTLPGTRIVNIWLGTSTVQVQGSPDAATDAVLEQIAQAVGRV